MGIHEPKREKVKKWSQDPPKSVPAEQVESVISYFFPEQFEKKPGSHIKIHHPKLAEFPTQYGPDGHITIPVSGGQRVKGFLFKKSGINYILAARSR